MAVEWKLDDVVPVGDGSFHVTIREYVDAVASEKTYSKKVHKAEFAPGKIVVTKAALLDNLAKQVKVDRDLQAQIDSKLTSADFANFEAVVGGLK